MQQCPYLQELVWFGWFEKSVMVWDVSVRRMSPCLPFNFAHRHNCSRVHLSTQVFV